ncbi:MAG: M3 family oligoendopeptidase, partial [Acidimicrobiia bacterium]
MTAQATATGAEEISWDLTDLFGGVGDPKLKDEIERTVASAGKFREKYHGKVGKLSAKELHEAVAELEELESALYRAFAYARLEFSVDTGDPARGALLQMLQEKATTLETELLFFQLEWVELEDEQANKLLEDPVLAVYRHYLEAARRYRPYVLSEPEEKILSEKRVSGVSAWGRLFTELVSSLKVELDGVEISLEEALSKLQQPNRELRRKAAEATTKTLRAGLRTHTFIFNTVLLDKATDDRLRGYSHWLASRNLSNEISDESVQALIDACIDRYDIPQRYYALKAKLLHLDKIADYD